MKKHNQPQAKNLASGKCNSWVIAIHGPGTGSLKAGMALFATLVDRLVGSGH